ncbi:hypothetical protein D3C80_1506530 [compost metagenome]
MKKIDQFLRDVPAAIAQTLFLLLRPALIGNGFTGEIDDSIEAVEILMLSQPFPDANIIAEHLARFIRAARDDGDVMFQRLQTWNKMATNQASTACHQNLHATSWLALSLASSTSSRRSRHSVAREVYRSLPQHK